MSLSSCIDGFSGYILPHKEIDSDIFYTKIDAESMLNAATDIRYNSLNDHTIIGRHDLDVLKTLPNDLLVEREKKCQECVKAHASTCIKKMKVNGKFEICDKRKMLLYGYCPDFESTDILEVEAAANGVD